MSWLTALDVPGLIFVCVFFSLLVLVILQGRTINRLGKRCDERHSFMLTWGQRTDPRYFEEHGQYGGIYLPDLGPEVPLVDCLEAGRLHEANRDGRTCKNCPADLTPARP